jgi:osmotically-inducible protein OsmY
MSTFADDIQQALRHTPGVDAERCQIEVTGEGPVRVDGAVDRLATKRRIARAAQLAVGPRTGIRDRIQVRPEEAGDDGTVTSHLLDVLMQDSAFVGLPVREQGVHGDGDGEEIRVAVQHGVVNLAGTVPSLTHRRLAEVVAWSTPGVCDVDNRLHVQPPEEDSDDEIADAILQALERDPALDPVTVRVSVRDAEVLVQGMVDRPEQKARAEDLCWAVPGVHQVDNRLAVETGA